MFEIDTKVLRAGTVSAFVLLFAGLLIGTYGGWQPIFALADSLVGVALVGIALSVFLLFVYQQWFANFLPGSSLSKGALYGFLVWALFLILGGLFPFFKESVYPNQEPFANLFLSLVVLSLWGAIGVLTLDNKN